MFRLPIVKFFNRIFNRVTITVVLVALQVLWLLWAFWSFTAGRVWLNGALKALSIMIVLYLVRKDENSAYKIGWIVLIGLLPLLGGALYLAFGNKAPAKYLRERMQKVEQAHQTELAQPEGQTDALDISSRNLSRYVAKFGPYPAWRDTAAHYFSCGEEMYPQLLADLDKAEKFIFLEYFIVEEGYMWGSVLEILKEKAAAGVEVRFMYDGMCSISLLPPDYPKKIRRFGIQCKMFSPIRPVLSTTQNNRDHRKICVIDGKTGFTGGINLGDEYINRKERFGYWKDTAVMIKGDAVQSLTMLFLQMWNVSELKKEKFEPYLTTMAKELKPETGFVLPYGDSPYDHENVGEEVYVHILNHAKKYVHIMTPYLILDNGMLDTLTRAAKSGIEVCIIMPHIPDKWYAFAVAKTYYRELIEAGVNIYEFTPGFVHAKVFVSDDDTATVGTVNLDYRSLYLHFECGIFVYDNPVVHKIEKDFQETLKKSCKVTASDIGNTGIFMRICGRVLRLIAPLM